MKYEFIKQVDGEVATYDGKTVRTGEIVDLDEPFASKARRCIEEWRAVQDTPSSPPDMSAIRAEYEAKFGEPPHHRKSAETLRREIDGDES